jgi:hypothetical protein
MGNEQDKRTRKVCESESDVKLTSKSLATLKISSAIVSTLPELEKGFEEGDVRGRVGLLLVQRR